MVIGVVLCITSLAFGAGQSTNASLTLSPQFVEVGPGDTFAINVLINTSEPAFAAQYTALFNPMVLEVVSQTKGPFLTSDGNSSTIIANGHNNTAGFATYGETRLKPANGTATGIAGNGTLATIQFHVKDGAPSGETPIIFKPDETLISDTSATSMPITLYSSMVRIVSGGVPPAGVYLRVESNTTTLFNDAITVPANCTVVDTSNVSHYIDHPTALGALVEAAQQAGFTYNITDYGAYGLFIADINGDTWVSYRINYASPPVGADQYNLTGGEDVLFATGQYYPFYPIYLVAPPHVPSGKPFQVGVAYYNDTLHNWDTLEGATVLVNDTSAGTTDEYGLFTLTLSDGMYQLRAEKLGYIRSDRMNVSVAGTQLPPGPPPDLATFLEIPPSTAQGVPMPVGVYVLNVGNGTADTSTLKVFANGTAVNETTVPVLAPHDGWYYLEFNYTPSSLGLLNITAIADYYEVLSDSNRSNNTAMQYVNVYSSLPLMADTFGVDSSTGQPNTSVVVPLNITNVRDGPIQTITFSIDYDESVILLQSIEKGPLTSSWGIVSLGGDKHSIALSTFSQADAIPNGSSGTVLYLNFSVVGSQGDSTLMSPTSIDFANTNNEHGTAIPTTGTFSVITQSTVEGQVTQSHSGAPVQGAGVTLSSDPMVTTTDASGNYEFTDVSLGTHQLTFTKEHCYTETASVNVVSGVNAVNMQLRLRGDLDNNGVQADAVDLNMMVQAVVHDLQSDKYFDLDQNGNEADAVDLNMMVQAVVHDIVL